MVTRRRLRSALLHLGLWLMSAGAVAYFGYHAIHGDRGLDARRSFDAEIAALTAELTRIQGERKRLEARAQQLEPQSVDRDLLDEQARTMLKWVHPNDRLVYLQP
jgi:cell division protein FtsB